MSKFIDITGLKFGRLTAKNHKILLRGKTTRAYWQCLCDCGNEVVVEASNLRSGNSKSCGCLQSEIAKETMTTHGKKGTRTHNSWSGMKARCYNKNHKSFNYYGKRGIKVCNRWHKFKNFLSDMGEAPFGLTLDRIDNNGDYEPKNCRWATKKTQANNSRKNKLISHNGQTLTLSQWAEKSPVSYDCFSRRLQRGWTMKKALLQPLNN